MKPIYFRISGLLLTALSILMLFPMAVAYYYDGYKTPIAHNELRAFLISAAITLIVGYFLLLFSKDRPHRKITVADGFMIVASGWIVVGCFTTLPYLLSGAMPSFIDALFESISGITTTGASVLSDLESMPRGIMFWRCMTQWIGGMGIIALFVAVLPALGEGSHNLFRAEIPGGTNFEKVTPRIQETARALWGIYVSLTIVEAVLLTVAGMPPYDAVCHSFTTLSTGGFSVHSGSVGDVETITMQWIVITFMIIGGTSFMLHYMLVKGEGRRYWENEEFRLFIWILVGAFLLIAVDLLLIHPADTPFFETLTNAAFQVTSILTTTGYTSADYGLWSPFAQIVLFCLMFVGGCAGSTSGSIKVIRHLIAFKAMASELKAMANPREVVVARLQGKPFSEGMAMNTFVFMTLFVGTMVIGALIIALMGADMKTAFSASIAALGNIGPGLGDVGPALNYGNLPVLSKLVLIVQMIMGRLELFGIMIFFMIIMRRKTG